MCVCVCACVCVRVCACVCVCFNHSSMSLSRYSLVPRPRGRREDAFSPPTRPGNEASHGMPTTGYTAGQQAEQT